MRVEEEEEDGKGVTCQGEGEGEGGQERDVTQTTPASRHVKTRLLATEISGGMIVLGYYRSPARCVVGKNGGGGGVV